MNVVGGFTQITLTEATVKRLMQTFDSDRNGQIGVQEFVCLYQFVLFLRNAFSSQDHNRSGKLDTCSLLLIMLMMMAMECV
jgi:Ca2+-binding EF-hand superfamily protein